MNWLFQASRKISNLLTVAYLFIISSKNNKRQTQMLQKKEKKRQKTNHTLKLTITKK